MPRNRMINLRADDDEFDIMQVAADAAGVKMGTWVRDVALQAASPAEPAQRRQARRIPCWRSTAGSAWACPTATNSVKRRAGSGGGSAGAQGDASGRSWSWRKAPWLTLSGRQRPVARRHADRYNRRSRRTSADS